MPNEYANKIIINGQTRIDLTGDTVTADKLMQGITAHDRSGAPITGTHDDLTAEPLSVSANGTYTAPAGKAYTPVTVNVAGGDGNPTAQPKDVNFIDYDGTIRYSYTADEFRGMTGMPPNPTHDGLTSRGWNRTRSSALSYLSDYGSVVVGQNYVTSDEKTHVYIVLTDCYRYKLGLAVNGTADIDWGDGSGHTFLTGTSESTVKYAEHEYEHDGVTEYEIKIGVTGTAAIPGLSSHTRLLQRMQNNPNTMPDIVAVELAYNMNLGDSAFGFCTSLRTITMPDRSSTGASYAIRERAFYNCRALYGLVYPNNPIIYGYTTYGCSGLRIVANVRLTAVPTYQFYGCENLVFVNATLNGDVHTYAFYRCESLPRVVFDTGAKTIQTSLLYACANLGTIKFLGSTPPTVENENAFYALPTFCRIIVPWNAGYPNSTNYPHWSEYKYIGYGTFLDGAELPTATTRGDFELTWYATEDDAYNDTNQIATGNGTQVYCRYAWAGVTATVRITQSGNSSYNYVKIPGSDGEKKYNTGTTTYYLAPGESQMVYCYMSGGTSYTKTVTVNGVEVASGSTSPFTYEYSMSGSIEIAFTGTSSSSNKTIAITEVQND